MRVRAPEVFESHAEFCKALANPKRIMMLAALARREASVGEIAALAGITVANASQHLRILRAKNIVLTRKEGQNVYCRLADPRLVRGCAEVRAVLLEELRRKGLAPEGVRAEELIEE
jgi:ArsR family transcriptional regulator